MQFSLGEREGNGGAASVAIVLENNGDLFKRNRLLRTQVLHDELVGLMENKIIDLGLRYAGTGQCFVNEGRHSLDREIENECAIHVDAMFARIRAKPVSEAAGLNDHRIVPTAVRMEGIMPV